MIFNSESTHRRLIFAACMLLGVIGCGPSEDPGANKLDYTAETREVKIDEALLGEWVTVATSAGHYDGVLILTADGKFTEEDVFKSDGTKQSVEGTFTVSSDEPPEVALSVTKLNGNAVSGGLPIKITYDKREQTLTNPMPGIVYARRAKAVEKN